MILLFTSTEPLCPHTHQNTGVMLRFRARTDLLYYSFILITQSLEGMVVKKGKDEASMRGGIFRSQRNLRS